MKKLKKLFITTVLLFVFLFIFSNLVFDYITKKGDDSAYILMNRCFDKVQAGVSGTDADAGRVQALLDAEVNSAKAELAKEFGRTAVPDRAYYIPAEKGNSEVSVLNRGEESDKIWVLRCGDVISGFIIFEYKNSEYAMMRLTLNICLAAALLLSTAILIVIGNTVLDPFDKLASYPEKLSKSEISDKLPETKNRMFGKFIWGINMLSDKLESNKKRVDELSRDHLTMLTTIAHGIKTPVANIKLYADAISTGLYRPDGTPDESDAVVAEKISKNADDVTKLVKELIDSASGAVVDFKPEINSFYLEEIRDFLDEEYSNRLKMLSIPYSFEVGHNAMINSDKSGILRILSQIMDNAVKYGNGGGINVSISKEDDGYYFVIRNRGDVPGEDELPYVFNSFWRGSNAKDTEGSGIGLYEAREIARKLYGDIYAKADPAAGEMEFDVYIPL